MSGFGIFWVILWVTIAILIGLFAGIGSGDEECGCLVFCFAGFISGLVLLISLCSTYPDTRDCFKDGYFIPENKQCFNLYIEEDGSVDIQQIYSISNGSTKRYQVFIKDDAGQRIAYTCPSTVKIEEWDETPMVEVVYSYRATGQMKGSTKLFWEDNDEHRIITQGCPEVLTLYVPKGTKVKTAIEQ